MPATVIVQFAMVSSRRSSQKRAPESERPVVSQARVAKPPMLKPSLHEILAAIQSLYDDEVKPLGRILRKRCGERAMHRPDPFAAPPDVDPRYLQRTCEESAEIRVESENGGEWTALLAGHPETFVDFYDACDPYPCELWTQAEKYFESLDEQHMVLPGGRYACAQALLLRDLPFLVSCSLGQACHIIQLAVSQKKILGYRDGDTVPYRFSQSRAKEECAAQQQPSSSNSDLVVATWDVVRQCLKQMLECAPGPRPGCVTVSNVKRIFRMRYQIELSETALGYSKVTDLLQDHRLHDLCSVQLQGRGYAVVEVMDGDVRERVEPAPVHRVVFCPDEPLSLEDALPVSMPMSEPKQESKIFALSPSVLAKDGLVGCMVRDTFIHFPQPTQSASSARQRSQSVPKEFGSHRDSFETECHALAFFPRSLGFDDRASVPHQGIDTPLPSPLTASGIQHADTPLLALEWGERCLSLGLVPWPVHLMGGSEMLLFPGYAMPQFIPVEPCVQWCWPPTLDKCCDNLSSAWSTCADSAECDAASVPGTPSTASQLRRHEVSQSRANPNVSSSNGSTPRSTQGADVSVSELTASQQHLMHLRASGQATLKVLASESASPVHESGWNGLEQWCNENNVACNHIDVADRHNSWRSCGETRQDAFTVHPALHTGLQWD